MNPEVKKMWVEALRSGRYKQSSATLKSDDGFCCLGVLCDLYSKQHPEVKWGPSTLERTYAILDNVSYLPKEIMKWAGLNSYNPTILMPEGDYKGIWFSLTSLNDGYKVGGSVELTKNFLEIADIIEEQK